MLLILLIIFGLLLIIGIPIGYILGGVSLVGLYSMGGSDYLHIIATRYHSGVESYVILAVPFFIFAAELMNRSGMTKRLLDFVEIIMGHFRGGLSHVNIVVSIIFAGLTGAAVTDTAAIGSIFIPHMKKDGYGGAYSAAVTCSSSIIGPIIPPSIIMVVYSYYTGLSVMALFASGFIPGLVMGLLLLVVSILISKRRKYPKSERRLSPRTLLVGIGNAFFALIAPLIILGSVLTGIATVTEASAVAVAWALFVGFIIYRTLDWPDIVQSLTSTARLTGVVFLLLACAHVFGWYITRARIPAMATDFFLTYAANPYLALLFINIFLLIVGMFIDILPAVLILAPVLGPACIKLGIHPLHYGMVMLVNLNIGMITPPFGMTMLTASRIAKVEYGKVIKEVIPFLIAELITLLLITYIPELILIIPRALGIIR